MTPSGATPQRKMREASISLKSNLQAGKQLKFDVFVLKVPDVASHRFHLTEGEVHVEKDTIVIMVVSNQKVMVPKYVKKMKSINIL